MAEPFSTLPDEESPQRKQPAISYSVAPEPFSQLPPGEDTPSPAVPAPAAKPDYLGGPYVANAMTGLRHSVGNAIGMPHAIGALGDYLLGKTGLSSDNSPGFITRHTYSPEDVNNAVNQTLYSSLPASAYDYKPETPLGQIGQDFWSTAPLAATGGGGLMGLLGRETANLAGNAGSDTAARLYPNSPGVQVVAGLLSGLLADRVSPTIAGAASAVKNLTGKVFATDNAVGTQATRNLLNSATGTAPELVNSIDQNLPAWNFPGNQLQPLPTTADVTGDAGLRNMTYSDQSTAAKANNPVYRNNFLTTNAAQREAVTKATPDITPQLTANRDLLANTLNGMPTGITAQDAGATFRQGLQNVYDQRLDARRQLGANVFDALDNSPAQISLRPVMDYATEQAAQNAGEVGSAYGAALRQFQSGTGITLDTAPFANSVLKGLGDLSQNYPPGSAAQRAVLDVKNRAEQTVFDQEPSIAQARQAYAQAAMPLDVFNPTNTPGPIANAVQTTRFGGYTVPNDAVVSQFLRSNGSADAIDKLNSVFPDVKSATQSLQDHVASEVQARAVNPDGTVNLNRLQQVTRQYQPVLNKLPFSDVKRQFSTIEGAQQAIDQLGKRQQLLDTFANGLGTMERDNVGNAVYSPAKFDGFVKANQSDLVNAYGQAGADRINQINDQLTSMAQTAQSKVKGQSGTPQAIGTRPGSGNVLSYVIGEAIGGGLGDTAAVMLEPAIGMLPAAGLGLAGNVIGAAIPYRLKKFNDAVDGLTRQALTDPAAAKALLTKYNPKMPTPAGSRALGYVRDRLAGVLAPMLNVGNTQQQSQ